ncbi:MAG: hypothetical protein K0R43_3468 [Pseudoduganella sp.]|jgi:hypothetical protein|nr:hypothetical protein [Pseudoduganella sp.]
MSFPRPITTTLTIGIVLSCVLASAQSSSPQAERFAALHHARCMQQRVPPAPEVCAMRTIQLASHLHGIGFADQVAEALY